MILLHYLIDLNKSLLIKSKSVKKHYYKNLFSKLNSSNLNYKKLIPNYQSRPKMSNNLFIKWKSLILLLKIILQLIHLSFILYNHSFLFVLDTPLNHLKIFLKFIIKITLIYKYFLKNTFLKRLLSALLKNNLFIKKFHNKLNKYNNFIFNSLEIFNSWNNKP